MKELKSIFGLLLLLVGGFVLYKVLPVYWGDFKLGQMLNEQAIAYTYTTRASRRLRMPSRRKRMNSDVPALARPDHGAARPWRTDDHGRLLRPFDLPIYPLDLNFKTAANNNNVMK